METALFIAINIIGAMLVILVLIQSKGGGLSQNDSSSIYRTKRGLEKTIHQTTIALAVVFLIIALIASLPLFPAPITAPVTPT